MYTCVCIIVARPRQNSMGIHAVWALQLLWLRFSYSCMTCDFLILYCGQTALQHQPYGIYRIGFMQIRCSVIDNIVHAWLSTAMQCTRHKHCPWSRHTTKVHVLHVNCFNRWICAVIWSKQAKIFSEIISNNTVITSFFTNNYHEITLTYRCVGTYIFMVKVIIRTYKLAHTLVCKHFPRSTNITQS